jgi:hypothetical protein
MVTLSDGCSKLLSMFALLVSYTLIQGQLHRYVLLALSYVGPEFLDSILSVNPFYRLLWHPTASKATESGVTPHLQNLEILLQLGSDGRRRHVEPEKCSSKAHMRPTMRSQSIMKTRVNSGKKN